MTEFSLVPHPDFPSTAIRSISVDVRQEYDRLELAYRVTGNVDDVLWPPPGPPGRADRLWEHSCFEAFIARVEEREYTELNLATSGQWAVYEFEDYRAGMQPVEDISFALSVSCKADELIFRAFTNLPVFETGWQWRVALSAIIEARDGTKSYWALAHPPGKPDFHNADCFTARLAAPDRA